MKSLLFTDRLKSGCSVNSNLKYLKSLIEHVLALKEKQEEKK